MSLPVTIGTECVVGHRMFAFMRPNFIAGFGKQVYMPCERAEAFCTIAAEHMAPDETCSCGFYARKSFEAIDRDRTFGDVYGEVYMWGRVVIGEFGYRAQYMYPKRLVVTLQELAPYAEYLGYLYGVPCTYEKFWPTWEEQVVARGVVRGQQLSLEDYIATAINDELPLGVRKHASGIARQRLGQRIIRKRTTLVDQQLALLERQVKLAEDEQLLAKLATLHEELKRRAPRA
jgi:hypothetical protein